VGVCGERWSARLIKCLGKFASFPGVIKEVKMETTSIASERVNEPKKKPMNDT